MSHWTTATQKKKITKVKESTEQEIFESLADSNNPAAILRLLSKCSENFIPHTTSPWCTTYFNVFNEKYTKLNYGQLLIESEFFLMSW